MSHPARERWVHKRPAEGHHWVVDMRAADADRNRAVEVLQTATSKGYLSLQEFESAIDRVYATRTYGELDALLAGVPGAPRPSVDWAPQPVKPAPVASPGSARARPVNSQTWLPAVLFRSPLRACLTVLFALILISAFVHAWPLPLIVIGIICWRRSHRHGWPGQWRRQPAEFV